jgi:peptidyl-tRNA hydrolase
VKKMLDEKFVNDTLSEVSQLIDQLKKSGTNKIILERETQSRFQAIEKKFDELIIQIAN